MPEPRLASSLLIGALRRKVESAGGFATILQKGDPVAGAILLVCLREGAGLANDENSSVSADNLVILEREPTFEGPGKWVPIGQHHTQNSDKISEYLARRSVIDPDLWIVELDVAQAERFAAEIIASH